MAAEAEATTWLWIDLGVSAFIAPIITGVSVGVAVAWFERRARRREATDQALRDAFWSPQHGLATALWRLDEMYDGASAAEDLDALQLQIDERRAAVEMLQLWHEPHLSPHPSVGKAIRRYMKLGSDLESDVYPGAQYGDGFAHRRIAHQTAYMSALRAMQQVLNPPYIKRGTLMKLWLHEHGWRWWPIPRGAPKARC